MNKLLKSNLKNMNELMKKSGWTVMLVVGLLVASCNDSGDPSLANVRLEMKALSNLAQLNTSGRMMNSSIEYKEAWIGVTEIEFETFESADDRSNDDHGDDSGNDSSDDRLSQNSSGDDDGDDDSDDDSDEIDFEGRFIVDLINGTSTPDFGIADVIPGLYREIEIKMRPILEDGNSLFIVLEYQPEGSDPIIIEYSTNSLLKFEIESYQGIQLEEGGLNQILVLLDLDQLFAGIDFNSANADVDGIIRINSSSNADLASLIWTNLGKAFDAGEDKDGDDDIDDDHGNDD